MTKEKTKEVAVAVRVELSENNDDLYLVFEIIDEGFKKRIKENWLQDIELKVIDKKLVES